MARWPPAVARSRVCSPRRSRPSPCWVRLLRGWATRAGAGRRVACCVECFDAIATTPPRAVGDLFARVTRESADRLEERLPGLEALDPPADEAAVDAACADLQQLADAAGAEVDLCVGLFAPPA